MAEELKKVFSSLLETQSAAAFTDTFSELPIDTLRFLDRIDRYIKVHNLKDEALKFQRVFITLSVGIRDRFFIDNKDESVFTIKLLKQWLLKNYPPPFSKHHFHRNLNSMSMRKNEDPKRVYDIFMARKNKINAAIIQINYNLPADAKFGALDDEFLLDALNGIFIRRNNNPKYGNVGNINRETFNKVKKADPHTLDDYEEVFKNITSELFPYCLQSHYAWNYIHYPSNGKEYDIYTFFRVQQGVSNDKNDRNGKKAMIGRDDRKRLEVGKHGREDFVSRSESNFGGQGRVGYNQRKRDYEFNYEGNARKRTKNNHENELLYCNRCGRDNHIIDQCHALYHDNGTWLGQKGRVRKTRSQRTAGKIFRCYACNEPGHIAKNCPSNNSSNNNSFNNSITTTNNNTNITQEQTAKSLSCRRCLRTTHLAQDCMETTFANGDPLTAKTMAAMRKNSHSNITFYPNQQHTITDQNASDNSVHNPNASNIDELETRASIEFRKSTGGQVSKMWRKIRSTDKLTHSQKNAACDHLLSLNKIFWPNGYAPK